MRPRNHLDGIQVAFDDHRLVDNAGLLLQPPWPCTSVFPNWYSSAWTWVMRRAGPTPATR